MAVKFFKKISGFRSFKLILFLSLVLIILVLLLIGQILHPQILNISDLKAKIADLVENSSLVEKSTADVSVDNNRLVFKFKIADKDASNFNQLANNLGVDPKVFDNISLELDKESLDKLRSVLPVSVNLEVLPKVLKFKDKSLVSLTSSVANSEFKLATESGTLNLKGHEIDNFSLQITDPKPLLIYATQSGQINLAKISYELFPILAKVGRMELGVNGKSVEGEVSLK